MIDAGAILALVGSDQVQEVDGLGDDLAAEAFDTGTIYPACVVDNRKQA